MDAELKVQIIGGPGGSAEQVVSQAGCQLSVILLLDVEEGNKHVCVISGVYRPSFFGVNLSLLHNLPRCVL